MLRFELGDKGVFVNVPTKHKEVDFDKYMYGLFSLVRRREYIKKDDIAHKAIQKYADSQERGFQEIVKQGKSGPNIVLDYNIGTKDKPKTAKANIHDMLDWFYNPAKEMEIIATGVGKFYDIDEDIMRVIKFGDMANMNEDIKTIATLTTVGLFKIMVNLVTGYRPKLKSLKNCIFKHRGRRIEIPRITTDKVLKTKMLPHLTTAQVLKSLKIEYMMNKDSSVIDDLEEVYPSGNLGWENLATNEYQKGLKKICIFAEDAKDPMPIQEHRLDEWIGQRMYFFGGYDKKGSRTKPSIKMTTALDCLFFLANIGHT